MRSIQIRLLLFVAVLSPVISSCTAGQETELIPTGISIDVEELSFTENAGSQTIKVQSVNKWSISAKPEWLTVESIDSKYALMYEWSVSLSVQPNDGYNREGTITFNAGNQSLSVLVSQRGTKGTYVSVESVSLSPSALTLTEGESYILKNYAISPSNASEKGVTWKSSSPSVATVSESGEVEALSVGTTTITVSSEDGAKTASCSVTVKAQVIPAEMIIKFEDENVKSCLVAAFDTNLDGEISYSEAGAATSIENVFDKSGSEYYKSFNEFIHFTGIVSIPDQCFMNWKNLSSICLPPSVRSIGESAFEGCYSLQTFVFPESISHIDKRAFYGCRAIKRLEFPEYALSFGDNVFEGCISLEEVILPTKLKEITFDMFYGCSALTRIEIPSSVSNMGIGAFAMCTSLEVINIPESVSVIASCLFRGCRSLNEITLPAGISSIGEDAFSDCSSLKRITIPQKVKSIESGAFWNCYADIYCLPIEPPSLVFREHEKDGIVIVEGYWFSGYGNIYVPAESLDKYKSASNWWDYSSYILPISE